MGTNKITGLIDEVYEKFILEIECLLCGLTITTQPEESDLYCQECKQIVMQNPLSEADLI